MRSIIIVGAGVIGLMCAVRLAKAGARVTVLEGEDENTSVWSPTVSASAAGMLAPFGEEPSPHDPLALASFNLWRQWRDGAAWADAVRFDGGIIALTNEAEAQAFAARVGATERQAVALTPNQFRKRLGFSAAVENAVFVADEGIADPLRTLSGLAMEARSLGVIVSYKSDVMKVDAHSVTLPNDSKHEADMVVLATGPWTSDAMIAAAPALKHIQPGKGCLVPVKLAHTLTPNLRGPGFYLASQIAQVVLGATLELGTYNRRIDEGKVEGLLAAANRLLPGEVLQAGRAWTGIRPMSPDGWPMIGRSGDVLIAAGHSRNGWLLAPITAEIITAYVMGADIPQEWAALSPHRFGTA